MSPEISSSVLEWPVDDLPVERRTALKHELLAELTKRHRRRTRARAIGGAAVVTAAGLAGVASVLTSPEPASAAWSAVPRPLSLTIDDPIVQQCVADLPLATPRVTGSAHLTPVVAERRGRSRAVLLEGDDSQGVCIVTPTSRSGGRTVAPTLTGGRDLSITGNGGATDTSGSRYVYGRVSARVVSVWVQTTSGLRVTSSVAHHSYLAWWPGGDGLDSVTAVDARGVIVATLRPQTR